MQLLFGLAIAATTFAQTPKPEFDVASIRVVGDDNSHRFSVDKNRLLTHNITLRVLVARAMEVAPEQVFGGPTWCAQEGYDILAKIPEGLSEKQHREQLSSMLQSLLADRYRLVFHREDRQVAGYTLRVGKGGSKLEAAKKDDKDNSMNSSRSELTAKNADLDSIAKFLADQLQAPVVDKTGLKGGYNFHLRWSPDALAFKSDAPPDLPPGLPTAIQEQLGLKLESGKISVPAIIIDAAQRPNPN